MPARPCNDDAPVLQLGLVRIGPMDLALPCHKLKEAMAHPGHLSRLLSASPLVVGAVDVRGQLLPVIDLRPALALPPQAASAQQILIVQHGDHLFGLVIDALGGVLTVDTNACQDLEVLAPSVQPLFSGFFSVDEGQRVVSLLHLDGVIGLADVPLVKAHSVQPAPGQTGLALTQQLWSPYILFEAGQTRLALNANHVDTVIDIDDLDTHKRPSQACLGVIQNESRRLAVLDGLQLLGLGHTDLQDNGQVLIIKVGANRVGILIRRVLQIARMNDGTVRPVPALAFAHPENFDGMLPSSEHGDHLRIAAQALLDMPEVSSMALVHGRPLSAAQVSLVAVSSEAPTQDEAKAAARRIDVYLTFKTGREMAAALKQIREILPMPAAITPISRPGDSRIGLFTHREQVLPIFDLPALLGLTGEPRSSESRLLLVDGQHGTLAFLVDRVFAIENAHWEHAPIGIDALRGQDELTLAIQQRGLLTLGTGELKRGVQALDLPRLARALEARHAPALPLQSAA